MIAAMVLGIAMQASPATYLRDLTEEMRKDWPNNRMVEIVCHGHSVPAGYFKTPMIQSSDAYPNLLRQSLFARFPHAVINVTVTAIGGENSIQGERRFSSDVLSRHPRVVTIDYGLNDRGLDPAKVRQAWRSMVDQAKAQNVKVLLLTPTADLSAKMDDPNDPLNQQAEGIRALAKDEGVGLVDSLNGFKEAIKDGVPLGDLMSQINHPNRKGHEIVAKRLLDWFPAQ